MNLDGNFGADARKNVPKFFPFSKKMEQTPKWNHLWCKHWLFGRIWTPDPRSVYYCGLTCPVRNLEAQFFGPVVWISCFISHVQVRCHGHLAEWIASRHFMTAMVKSHDGPRFFAESCPTAWNWQHHVIQKVCRLCSLMCWWWCWRFWSVLAGLGCWVLVVLVWVVVLELGLVRLVVVLPAPN